MLWIKALHIITMVAWFAGLFYLPRLFVYHANTIDSLSIERFKLMERRLYYAITWPAAVTTTFFGIMLITYNTGYYMQAGWMHVKLTLVCILWVYHWMCGYYLKGFAKNCNKKSSRYFRMWNELPTVFLISIVILVVVKPF